MSFCDAPGLIPLEEALDRLLNAIQPISDSETLAIEHALDRILAANVVAPINVPGHDNSAMDGYAVLAENAVQQHVLTNVGNAFAGQPFNGTVQTGQCVRIMTGAELPSGTDAVVMQENTSSDGKTVTLNKRPSPHENVRFTGEDITQGKTVLSAGRRLTPADIGLLASLGLAHVTVMRPLQIAIFSTGDELRLPGEALDPSCIYDSNRFVVGAMLKRLGINVINLGIIADNKNRLRATMMDAAGRCDAIISSGGVSVGEADYTKDILDELGQVDFWKVAIKPGKPFAFGNIQNTVFFGLPGNPVSSAVTFHQLALPAIRKLTGETVAPLLSIQAKSQHPLRKRPGRTDYQRGVLSHDEHGQPQVCDTGSQGSGQLSSMSQSNCYIKLPSEQGRVEAGEMVEVIVYDRWIG